jgi:hypothetical protein
MTRNKAILLALGAWFALAAPAHAADVPAKPEEGGTFTVQIENDKFTPGNADKHYTNGFRLDWTSDKATGADHEWLRDALSFLYPLADVRAGRIGFSAGQTIYTPDDTDAYPPSANDRPYAGWLFVGASLHAETSDIDPKTNAHNDQLDSVELTLGVVGPHAYGRQVQNEFHSIIGVDPSHGWDYQLKDEPAFNMLFERRWRPEGYKLWGLEADAIPYVGGSVGNVFDFVGTGAILRIGQGIKNDYGPAHIQPSLSGLEAVEPYKGLWWYAFGGLEGRAVLHNIFLDGNTFADGPSVDRNVWVGDLQFGLALAYDRYRIALTDVYRTREFEGQDGNDNFAAINLSVHF